MKKTLTCPGIQRCLQPGQFFKSLEPPGWQWESSCDSIVASQPAPYHASVSHTLWMVLWRVPRGYGWWYFCFNRLGSLSASGSSPCQNYPGGSNVLGKGPYTIVSAPLESTVTTGSAWQPEDMHFKNRILAVLNSTGFLFRELHRIEVCEQI